MNNFDKYENKDLSKLFKEVQDIRYGRANPIEEKKKDDIKFNKIYVIDHKFNFIGAIIGVLFIIGFFSFIKSDAIFAASEIERDAIIDFEKNDKAINIMSVISENISEFTKKEIITNKIDIPYQTHYKENSQLPKDENKVSQEGVNGYMNQTVIRSFENGELIEENVIHEDVKLLPKYEIIDVGTSEYLKDRNVHIGDTLYTVDRITLYQEASTSSDTICDIYAFIDITLNEIDDQNGWAFISVDGIDGYVRADFLTSETKDSQIKEKCRVQRLLISVNPDMEVNKPSGLTKDDFVRVLSGNASDRNRVIEDNAQVFYEVEQKYNINGLFLAAMGIHESNWGTSNISVQKKNLFGYGSYDSSPYNSSYAFDSYAYGIDLVAKVLVKYYINEPGTHIFDGEDAVGSYYNGPTVSGVNVRYASDPGWSDKIYSIMVSLYEKL